MARMEMAPAWKRLADFFKFSLVSQIKSVKPDFGQFFTSFPFHFAKDKKKEFSHEIASLIDGIFTEHLFQ